MWYDSSANTYYQYGGEIIDAYLAPISDPALSVWAFQPDGEGGGSWSDAIPSTDSTWKQLTRADRGQWTQRYDGTAGYYLSGLVSQWTDVAYSNISFTQPLPIPGLLEFDTQKQTFQNKSSLPYGGDGYLIQGAMEFVPIFGDEGILVIFGGSVPGDPTDALTSNLQNMNNITVVDVASGKWYSQQASGDVPFGRVAFCTLGVFEQGSGSFEM